MPTFSKLPHSRTSSSDRKPYPLHSIIAQRSARQHQQMLQLQRAASAHTLRIVHARLRVTCVYVSARAQLGMHVCLLAEIPQYPLQYPSAASFKIGTRSIPPLYASRMSHSQYPPIPRPRRRYTCLCRGQRHAARWLPALTDLLTARHSGRGLEIQYPCREHNMLSHIL